MSSADEQSFVTIIIDAHGEDYIRATATAEQTRTLRKLTVAGVNGNYSYHMPELKSEIFRLSDMISNIESWNEVSFHKKLDILRDFMRDNPIPFNYYLQMAYLNLEESEQKGTIAPIISDWFSTSHVSYNHAYQFKVNDPKDPWEKPVFGIWFADGSPSAKKQVGFKKNAISIQRLLGFPEWDFETHLFEIASKIKEMFKVKYVNFIDLSCRYSPRLLALTPQERISRTKSIPNSAPTPRAGAELININGIILEIIASQEKLPPNWKYVRVIHNDKYAYFNTVTNYFSDKIPKKGGGFLRSKKKKNSKFLNKPISLKYGKNLLKRLL
jgi:hypothetical protein